MFFLECPAPSNYSDFNWVLRQLKSQTTQLIFFLELVQANNKERILALTLCAENQPMYGGFLSQRYSNAEGISM